MARLDVTETFHGILFPGHLHTQESLQFARTFRFQDRDIVIASYPKSGTTWMQQIVTLICSGGDPHVSHTVPNWTRAPWLEQYYSKALMESFIKPRVITTHLPYQLLDSAVQGSKAKIIYVSRNPKDVVVSFYHFHKMAKFLPDPGSFSEFVHGFLEGSVHYGSWFDHVLGWTNQEAALNLLHIRYEEMLLDPKGTIQKVSSFLQRPLLEEEVNSCVKHSTFSSMKHNQMINYTLISQDIMDQSKGPFMRKGEIGDWKSMFTEELSQCFQSVFISKMQDCSLEFVWEQPDGEQQHSDQQSSHSSNAGR